MKPGKREGRQLKENAGTMIKGTNVKNLLLTASMVKEGRDEKATTNTKRESDTTHSPARGGGSAYIAETS